MLDNGKILFNLQRFQILSHCLIERTLRNMVDSREDDADSPDNVAIPDAYAYAWMHGVYPLFHECEYSNALKEEFPISEKTVTEVFSFLRKEDTDGKHYTLYELEAHFGTIQNGERCKYVLMSILRYAYLCGTFNKPFWEKLTERGGCPVGMDKMIICEFDISEIRLVIR